MTKPVLATVPEIPVETITALPNEAVPVSVDASPKPVEMPFDSWATKAMARNELPLKLKNGYVAHPGRRYIDAQNKEHESVAGVKLPPGTKIALPLREAKPLLDQAKAELAVDY